MSVNNLSDVKYAFSNGRGNVVYRSMAENKAVNDAFQQNVTTLPLKLALTLLEDGTNIRFETMMFDGSQRKFVVCADKEMAKRVHKQVVGFEKAERGVGTIYSHRGRLKVNESSRLKRARMAIAK